MGIVVTIREAEERIGELLQRVRDGEHVVVTENGKPIANLVSATAATESTEAQTGSGILERSRRWMSERGIDQAFPYVAPDFDAPLPETLDIDEPHDAAR
jgi:prevent-host-death family protein